MKRFGTFALLFVGFVAGMAFVFSCGGGGSKVLAEITSVLGIEDKLDNITNAILGIEATTDTTGVESGVTSLTGAVNSIETKLTSIDSTLASVDTTLQNINLSCPEMSSGVSTTLIANTALDYGTPLFTDPIPVDSYSQVRVMYITDVPSSVGVAYSYVIGGIESRWINFLSPNSAQVYSAEIMSGYVQFRITNLQSGTYPNISFSVQLL